MQVALGAFLLVTETQEQPVEVPAEAVDEVDAGEQDVNEFLGIATETAETEAPDSESESTASSGAEAESDTEFDEAVEARVAAERERIEREAQARASEASETAAAKQAREQAERAFQQSFRGRIEEAGKEAYDLAIEAGLDEAKAQDAKRKAESRFNQHHADGLKVYGQQAASQAAQQSVTGFNDGVRAVLGERADAFFGTAEEPRQYRSHADALKALGEVMTEGMFTEAQAKQREKEAVLAYRRKLEKDGQLQARSTKAPSGNSPARKLTREQEDDILMNSTDLAQLKEIRARRGLV